MKIIPTVLKTGFLITVLLIFSSADAKEINGFKLDDSLIPVMHTTWADWKRLHPSTQVLSVDTGYKRNYSSAPYSGYEKSQHLYFPVFNKAPEKYHPKERVLTLFPLTPLYRK